ncbi:MAG: hypothetical protein MJ108_03045 [Saccharofermentans sp.]|nr:hypothetical protein [Saccharofermentans sp.]
MKRKHSKPSDELSSAMVEVLDADVIVYDGVRTKDGITIYTLTIESNNTEGAGDEIKKLYNSVNDVLQDSESISRIEIAVMTYHFDMGAMNYAAVLRNFTPDNKLDCDNHISYIHVNGIDDMYKYYDSEYIYELNCFDYWDSYTDATEINYSSYVVSLNAAYTCYPDIEKMLNDKYSTNIKLNIPTAEDKIIYFTIAIEDESLYENNEDLTNLFESIRSDFNKYLLDNPNCDLTGRAMCVSFYFDGENTYLGCFRNSLQYSNDIYDNFACIDYREASVEELISCDGIIAIVLHERSLEEINFVLSNMDGIEKVEVFDQELREELRQTYSNIEFY